MNGPHARLRRFVLMLLTPTLCFGLVAEPPTAQVVGAGPQARPIGRKNAADEQTVLYSTRNPSGTEYEYRVSKERLLLTRAWTPEREAPPLSTVAAVSTAKKRRKPGHPDDLQVLTIEIASVAAGEAYRWYYKVELYDTSEAYGDVPPGVVYVVILMDGSVVEPVRVR